MGVMRFKSGRVGDVQEVSRVLRLSGPVIRANTRRFRTLQMTVSTNTIRGKTNHTANLEPHTDGHGTKAHLVRLISVAINQFSSTADASNQKGVGLSKNNTTKNIKTSSPTSPLKN